MLDQPSINSALLQWWDRGHAALPWRENRDPYRVWVAEIMLQQTQISTVIPYYERWLDRFPTVAALAEGSLDDVLKLWQGLGYYARARNMHQAAREIMDQYNGKLPSTVKELMGLKGIGRYTAGAIASIAFERQAPILDGNIVRVLSRLVDLDQDVTLSRTKNQLWHLAETLVPANRPGEFNEALMELGQRLCLPAKPNCQICPFSSLCKAKERGTLLERPVRPPRKNTPHFHVAAGVIWRGSQSGPNAPFLIAQRPLDGLLGGLWEFPGGKLEDGESLPEALHREIQEELAMEIEVGKPLTRIKHAYTHFRITLHAFYAIHIDGEPQHLGVSDHAWVTLKELDQYAFAVTDLKIINALKEEMMGRLS